MPNSHVLPQIVRFLEDLKQRGTYGQTVITWRGNDIPYIEHTEKYLPGGLPNTSAPDQERAHIT